jgi:hypothetical protein
MDALRRRHPPAAGSTPWSESVISRAAFRWTHLVLAVLRLEFDIPTIGEWGRHVGISRGTLKIRCAAVGVTAKNSLDFARVLRAVLRHDGSELDLFVSFDVLDPRTLSRLAERSGLQAIDRKVDLNAFLSAQQMIRVPTLLAAIRQVLTVDFAQRH